MVILSKERTQGLPCSCFDYNGVLAFEDKAYIPWRNPLTQRIGRDSCRCLGWPWIMFKIIGCRMEHLVREKYKRLNKRRDIFGCGLYVDETKRHRLTTLIVHFKIVYYSTQVMFQHDGTSFCIKSQLNKNKNKVHIRENLPFSQNGRTCNSSSLPLVDFALFGLFLFGFPSRF